MFAGNVGMAQVAVCPQTNCFPSLGLPAGALSRPHHFLKTPGSGRSWWLAKAEAAVGRGPGAGHGLKAVKAQLGQP